MVARYFAPILARILLLARLGGLRARASSGWWRSRSRRVLRHISSYSPQYKSDMRDVGGEMAPLLHQGDLVVVGQPDQTPLAWYYLPAGLQ